MTKNNRLGVLRPVSALRDFLESEAAGGLILMGAAALALIIANSPLSGFYFETLHSYVLGLSIEHWINDGLMALFFLLVGLEIKREVMDGQLRDLVRRLPLLAAAAGMAVAGPGLSRDQSGMRRPSGAGRSRRPPISRSRSVCSRCSASARRAR